jgi:hypothetical protein
MALAETESDEEQDRDIAELADVARSADQGPANVAGDDTQSSAKQSR